MCLLHHCAATVWGDSFAIETCCKCKRDSSQLHRMCISTLYSVALYKLTVHLSNVSCILMMQLWINCENFLGCYVFYAGPPSYEFLVAFKLTACHIWCQSIHPSIHKFHAWPESLIEALWDIEILFIAFLQILHDRCLNCILKSSLISVTQSRYGIMTFIYRWQWPVKDLQHAETQNLVFKLI